jgi:hypothetical protein
MPIHLQICNRSSRLGWFLFAALLAVSEVLPVPRMPPLLHYGVYSVFKVLCFLTLGYTVPLAFVRVNMLHRGVAVAAISAVAVEVLQGFVGNGHRFHFYELFGKCLLIVFGFVYGLDARCMGSLDIWKLHVKFDGVRYLKQPAA